jgi:hypothetical protein
MGCWGLDNKILICLALCYRYFGYSSDEGLGFGYLENTNVFWRFAIGIYGILCSMEFLITCHHLAPLLLKNLKRKRYHTYVTSRYDICFSP